MRRGSVTQRNQLSIFVRADGKSLLGARALPGRIEHLRPREREFYRSLHELRGRGREQGVAPLKSLGAKRAANKWTDDAHIFSWQAERIGHDSLELFDPARRFVNEQAIWCFPFCGGRISLDRIMVFDRCGIDDVDLVRG